MKDHAQNPWKILLNQDDVAGLFHTQTYGIPEASLTRVPRCPVLFPLTPPLSQRERVYMASPAACCCALSQRERGCLPRHLRHAVAPSPSGREGVCRATCGMLLRPLPLPSGEGWGEGEGQYDHRLCSTRRIFWTALQVNHDCAKTALPFRPWNCIAAHPQQTNTLSSLSLMSLVSLLFLMSFSGSVPLPTPWKTAKQQNIPSPAKRRRRQWSNPQ